MNAFSSGDCAIFYLDCASKYSIVRPITPYNYQYINPILPTNNFLFF